MRADLPAAHRRAWLRLAGTAVAGGIIAAQRREIRFMEKWLKEHAQGAETADMPEWLKNNPTTPEDAKAAGAKD